MADKKLADKKLVDKKLVDKKKTKNNMVTRIKLKGREIILVGTAHISQESVEDVERTIRKEKPDTVCIELDRGRYQTIVDNSSWKNLNISNVIRERKVFLLFANIILSSFQKRLGLDVGSKPGEEMIRALRVAEEMKIPFEFCDREVQITLRRAWSKSSFWGKMKMLAALSSSIFSKEKLSVEDMEKLKEKSLMHTMFEELSGYLPKVKEVLLDERDRYLATKIFRVKTKKIVAVLGAGHIDGVTKTLKLLEKKEIDENIDELDKIPKKSIVGKILPWTIPVLIAGLMVLNSLKGGPDGTFNSIMSWAIFTWIGSAIGAVISLNHPVAMIAAIVTAPLTTFMPIIGPGTVGGLIEYRLRKPQVKDFEALKDDMVKIRFFYRNRILKVLLVYILANLGGILGKFAWLAYMGSQLPS